MNVYASETEHGGDNIISPTFTTGGFFGSSSWTFGIDGTMVDPMYYSDREGFDSSYTIIQIMVQLYKPRCWFSMVYRC